MKMLIMIKRRKKKKGFWNMIMILNLKLYKNYHSAAKIFPILQLLYTGNLIDVQPEFKKNSKRLKKIQEIN